MDFTVAPGADASAGPRDTATSGRTLGFDRRVSHRAPRSRGAIEVLAGLSIERGQGETRNGRHARPRSGTRLHPRALRAAGRGAAGGARNRRGQPHARRHHGGDRGAAPRGGARALRPRRALDGRLCRARGDAPGDGAGDAARPPRHQRRRRHGRAPRGAGEADRAFAGRALRRGHVDIWQRSVHPERLQDAALRRVYDEMAQETGPETFIRQTRAIMGRRDSRPMLPSIGVPTLVLVGDEDRLTPPEQAREMAALVPAAALVVVPRCGHLSTLERPDAVSEALEDWLAG
jgi:pimeloyl-ACP methyl ester carboxylesterase